MSSPIVSELIDLLQLERIEDNLFRGQSRDIGTRYVFGGQVSAALSAAQQTVAVGRNAHSRHAYFLRAGDIDAPIVLQRRTQPRRPEFLGAPRGAIQHGQRRSSQHALRSSPGHGAQASVPDAASADAEEIRRTTSCHPTKTRQRAGDAQGAGSAAKGRSSSATSIRATNCVRSSSRRTRMSGSGSRPRPDSDVLHRSACRLRSRISLSGRRRFRMRSRTATERAHGQPRSCAVVPPPVPRRRLAAVFVRQSSAEGSRGLARGMIFSRDGVLVASTAQQGLIRVVEKQE